MNTAFENKRRHQKNGAKGAVTTTTEKNRTRKGKGSKYGKKKGKKKALPPIKRGAPVFEYLCECHDQRATKEPCERRREDRAEGKFSESPLGKWHCSVTKRKCKVRRHKVKPAEELTITNEPGDQTVVYTETVETI